MRVELQPNALTQYGISLDDVRRAISQANLLRPKGAVEDGQRYWQVQASDQLTQAADYQPLIVTLSQRRAGAADDVARSLRRRRGSLQHRLLQQPAGGAADRQPPARRQHHRDRRRDPRAAADAARLPAGRRRPDIASDRSPSIRATLHEAERSLFIAVALVILVVLLFLASFRAAMIPVAAVPVALSAASP